ncbi:MAG: serine hydrolase [Streptomyces sp.]|uniref:serine hydrolase n=1 Tax=Streptomyces sp. TaxID=1931 RepID=UPI0025E5663A|nr:serine hydrolase [Streptomyces sp.]MBW8795102.1 serine hydrolase [Streptomyces sp.]
MLNRTLSVVATVVTLLAGAAPAAMAAGAGSGTTDFRTTVQARGTARVTAAVLDLDATGGEPAVYGDDTPYDTASIVKVDILAAMLLHARDHRRALTARESAEAQVMIRDSDNTAATALWRAIGEAPGLASANERLGLTSTQGGPGGLWGLTRTTAADQIRLLRAIFGTGSTPLDAASRNRIGTLMSEIATEQSWGVSAAADAGWALKNGWLMRTTTGLWDINSIGRITTGGHHYLVAVLSDGNASMPKGVSLVERAVRTAVAETAAH